MVAAITGLIHSLMPILVLMTVFAFVLMTIKVSKGSSNKLREEEEQIMQEMYTKLRDMEQRVESLETILLSQHQNSEGRVV